MTDTLVKLFGSSARVKVLRLFLFNPEVPLTIEEVARRARVHKPLARREVNLLYSIGALVRLKRKRTPTYTLNLEFVYLAALKNLILNAPVRGRQIAEELENTGAIKLIVISGVFMGVGESSLDLFIVGDRVNDQKLHKRLQSLEAEIGKELRYSLLSSEEFFYRLNMSDRLIRDVFDYPHRVVYDRLDIGLK
jgi:hypothetical protein